MGGSASAANTKKPASANGPGMSGLSGAEPLTTFHSGIKCSNGHHLCPNGSKAFVGTVISEPNIILPVKCSMCNAGLNSADLEKHMTSSQLETFKMIKKFEKIRSSGEEVMNCPYCKYGEVWKNKSTTVFVCKNKRCGKVSCIVCQKPINVSKCTANKQIGKVRSSI